MKMKTLAAALSALSVFAIASPAEAVQFSQTVFFGDSLTDSGSYGARFTTNPGTVWAQNLATQLGTTALPFLGAGGTDYAQGGSRVTQVPGIGFPQVPATPVSQQIDAYLKSNPKADPNALYTVWAGANDIFTQVGLAGAGVISATQAGANVAQAANDLVAQVQRLTAAGARYIIVPNIPNIGATPFATASGASATFTGITQLYNRTLSAGLAAAHVSIIPLNMYGLNSEVLANPATFGITNITSPACTTASSLQCTPNTLVAPNAPTTYSFADGVHPTTAGHRILSDYAYSVLSAPTQIGLLAETPLRSGEAQRYALDNRMRQPMDKRATGSFDAWLNADYTPFDISNTSASPGVSSRDQNATVGVDRQFTDRIMAGLALGYNDMRNDFGNSGGSYTQRLTTVTAYGLWRVGGASYLNALASAGSIKYGTVNRSFALGISTRTESGSTSGNYKALRVGGGMDVANGPWTYGPVANLTWQKVSVDAYSENSGDSSSMAYGTQDRSSLVGSMGGRVSYAAGNVRPFGQVTYQHEFKKDQRSVSASINNMPGTFTIPAYTPDRNYALLAAGLVADLSKSTSAVLAVNSILGQRDTRSTGIGLNIRFGF